MARRRRPRLWQPIPLTDDWLADVWELTWFGGFQPSQLAPVSAVALLAPRTCARTPPRPWQ